VGSPAKDFEPPGRKNTSQQSAWWAVRSLARANTRFDFPTGLQRLQLDGADPAAGA